MANKNDVDGKILLLYPEQIRVRPGFNVRHDLGDMKGLQASIAESGVRIPIKVIKTKDLTNDDYPVYELVDGHRRTKAATAANVMVRAEEIPFTSEADLIASMLSTGIGNKEYTILERAEGIRRYINQYAEEHDGAQPKNSEIARTIGATQTHVQDCLLLLNAPEDVLKQVRKGSLSASFVVEALKNTSGDGDELAESIRTATATAEAEGKKKITKKEVEKAAGKKLTKKGAASRSTKAGVQEESGTAETLSPTAKVVNKLISLDDALMSQEDMTAKRNPVAFATLHAVIAYLSGKMEIVEMADIFFGTGENLPKIGEEKKAAPAKSSKKEEPKAEAAKSVPAANAGGVQRGKLKEALNMDEPKAKKGVADKKTVAPAKSSAPKKSASKKSEDLDEDGDNEAEKAASKVASKKGGSKVPLPTLDDDDDDFDDDDIV